MYNYTSYTKDTTVTYLYFHRLSSKGESYYSSDKVFSCPFMPTLLHQVSFCQLSLTEKAKDFQTNLQTNEGIKYF